MLHSELGRGSNGVVFLASREGLPQCALKVLKDDLGQDEEALRRFRLEAAVAFKLTHPGIIRVLDAGMIGAHSYMVMEYCPGETLAQRLVRGPLPPDEAQRLLIELGSAVAQAHQQGVIHRDLKPSNVILEEGSGRPRLTDFGLTRDRSLARSMTKSGDVLGTPAYMSPEQFRGQKDVDERVDVWGLGAILYECLTGRRPFPAVNVTDLAIQVLEEPLPAPSQFATVPPALEVVCKKALAKDRGERYPSAVELVRALEVANEAALGASRSSRRLAVVRRPDAGTPSRRISPALLVAGALLLVGVVFAGAIAWTVVLPGREARAAIAHARAQVEGSAPAAEALAALDEAEARVRRLGRLELLGEADQLRSALGLVSRADELLAAGEDAARQELVAQLRERSRGAGDRWCRTAGLLETRLALDRLAAELEQGKPAAELEAALAKLPEEALKDPRLQLLREQLVTRLAAHSALDEAREVASRSWRNRKLVLETFTRCIDQARSEPAVVDQLRLERARWHLRRGMLDEAIAEADGLVDRPGRVAGEAGLVKATGLVWQGWFIESFAATDQVARRDPRAETVPGLKAQARVLSWSRGRDKERGERFARQALELDPQDVEAATLAGQCALDRRAPERALAELQELTRRAPHDTSVWIAYMLTLDAAGRGQESDAAGEKAVDLVTPSPAGFVWLTRGLLRIMRGRDERDPMALQGAQQDFERCERLEPENVRPRLYRATLGAMDSFQSLMMGDMRPVQPLFDVYDQHPQETLRFVDNLPLGREVPQVFRMLLQQRQRGRPR